MKSHVMKEVLASAWRPRTRRAFSRYDGTSWTGRRTESAGEHLVVPGMKPAWARKPFVSGSEEEGEAGGESGRLSEGSVLQTGEIQQVPSRVPDSLCLPEDISHFGRSSLCAYHSTRAYIDLRFDSLGRLAGLEGPFRWLGVDSGKLPLRYEREA